eukprot:CAMPEP_0195264650 /NCGR_PEP_ID=MMETSP0706-20130129/10979_1 /TAXON_ID=33640 /ORGANISM="Asterionellopsis glacialis, Strain CCMP134" /LENGTH=65 /DNA_ID=CAMNT_0040318967 /DNA_START=109 /DNA_END=306 /DNA_ORIENTATION=-
MDYDVTWSLTLLECFSKYAADKIRLGEISVLDDDLRLIVIVVIVGMMYNRSYCHEMCNERLFNQI